MMLGPGYFFDLTDGPVTHATQVPVPVKPTGGGGPWKVIALVVDEEADLRYMRHSVVSRLYS